MRRAATRAIFIDALGTMLELEPPWERIDPSAVAGLAPERVRAGFEAEMAYYRENMASASEPDSLAALRERCAGVLSESLGREVGVPTMMRSIRFRPYADAAAALAELRSRGLTLVCVSNWDCSLPEVLDRAGLQGLLDGVVTSAVAGAAKPDPAIFAPALQIAGCSPGEAIHVGDTDEDVEAARAAGIEALRIDRGGEAGPGEITSLAAISHHLAPR
ncbi:MAG TPA: HAD-IA family hydrolase [Solirubrobacterales bacterium]|nr:HAD-IA family hydrolase [Solirubrobacterales bacterium]